MISDEAREKEKPCPKCGCFPRVLTGYELVVIECIECGLFAEGRTDPKAVKLWNQMQRKSS